MLQAISDGPTNQQTDGLTNQATNRVAYRVACMRLKTGLGSFFSQIFLVWDSPRGLSKSLQWLMSKKVSCQHNFTPVKDELNKASLVQNCENTRFGVIFSSFSVIEAVLEASPSHCNGT